MTNVNSANSYLNLMGYSIIEENETFITWQNNDDSSMKVQIDKIGEEFSMMNENGDFYDWFFLDELEDFIF